MPYFEINVDRGDSELDGAAGPFQVLSIQDEDGDEVTENFVEVGAHYRSLSTVRKIIATKLGVSADQVELVEV